MSATAPHINLGSTYGAVLISCFISVGLYGVTCMQSFLYYVNYPKDPMAYKLLVAFLWAVDTAHQVVICVGIYRYLVVNFGNPAIFPHVFPEFLVQVLLTGLCALAAQSLLTYRIWIFSKKNFIYPLVILPLAVMQMVYCVRGFRSPTLQALLDQRVLTYVVNGVAAGVDLALAALMCHLLWNRRTGFHRVDRMLVRLTIVVVNTGAITAIFGLLTIVTLLAFPHTEIYTAAYFPICPLYCNTILGNLNVRAYVRGGQGPIMDLPLGPATNVSSRPSTMTKHDTSVGGLPVSVYMETRTEQDQGSRRVLNIQNDRNSVGKSDTTAV